MARKIQNEEIRGWVVSRSRNFFAIYGKNRVGGGLAGVCRFFQRLFRNFFPDPPPAILGKIVVSDVTKGVKI